KLSSNVDIYHEKNLVYVYVNEFKKLNRAVKKQVLFNMLRSIKVTKDISSKHVNKIIELIQKNKTTFDLNISNDIVVKRRYEKLYFEYKIKENNIQNEDKKINIKVDNLDNFKAQINNYKIN